MEVGFANSRSALYHSVNQKIPEIGAPHWWTKLIQCHVVYSTIEVFRIILLTNTSIYGTNESDKRLRLAGENFQGLNDVKNQFY